MRKNGLVVRILLLAFLSFSFPAFAQDTTKHLCGMYQSNTYKRNFYVLADDSNDTLLFKGKPRNIHDFIYFLPDSNKVLYDDESWGACTRKYKQDMTPGSLACWVGHAEYEMKGDSIKIFYRKKEEIVLLYTGTHVNQKLVLRRHNASMIYPREHDLIFEKCMECQ